MEVPKTPTVGRPPIPEELYKEVGDLFAAGVTRAHAVRLLEGRLSSTKVYEIYRTLVLLGGRKEA